MSDFKITLTNYEFEIPGNWNIVLMANYRTGSTAFGNLLSKIIGLPFLGEVFHYNPSSRPCAYDPAQQSIVKIMPNHMPPEEHWDSLFNNSYVIGLYREDIAAQVLSYAIAYRVGKWQQERNANSVFTGRDFALQLTNAQIVPFVNTIRETLAVWNNCKEYFDTTLSYEKIETDLSGSDIDRFPKITAYDEVLSRLREIV
jgi:hypothetical protein